MKLLDRCLLILSLTGWFSVGVLLAAFRAYVSSIVVLGFLIAYASVMFREIRERRSS
jgi:hypothetical protein